MKLIFKNNRNFTHKNFRNAVDTSEMRPQFSGIFVDIPNKYLVGTDGHTLVQYPMEIVTNNVAEQSFRKTIPVSFFDIKSLNLKKKDLADVEYVMFDENLEMRLDGEVLKSMKYIEGEFPNYVHTVPTEHTIKHGIDSIGIRNQTLSKLMRSLPNSDFKFTLFAKNKAILLQESIYVDDEIRPVIAIIMPTLMKCEM